MSDSKMQSVTGVTVKCKPNNLRVASLDPGNLRIVSYNSTSLSVASCEEGVVSVSIISLHYFKYECKTVKAIR